MYKQCLGRFWKRTYPEVHPWDSRNHQQT